MAHKWTATLPAGRFMGGQVLHFRTKAKLEAFLARWNETARNAGETELRFYRSGPTRFEALPEQVSA